jgi:hypothetical protein
MEKVRMNKIKNGIDLEVVNKVPKNYTIFHMSVKDVENEYLPLVEINKDKDDFSVNYETMKCVKLKSAQNVIDVLNGVWYMHNANLKKLQNYYKKNKNSARDLTKYRTARVLKAIKALEGVEFE